ncbi:hypothetical protein AI2618V1_1700 [Serratia marcescens]|uniref:hypothetical protein n=1 Tax=Serratia TaxID=613 RepID=UPI0008A3AA9A|nr:MULTISPECIES: hypothetical protein [Serratia]EME9755823.1 hypothetical protein [Serratia marcescens]MDP8624785.1 hypothetical protein [Serratia marcescens]MDP8674216.1 hypothetical protein [Serratia marcescens]MDP8689218.1 hypothetical protein [Serratia marcescens]MDP8698965.1 hypothetical protein [Serratia marcescens]
MPIYISLFEPKKKAQVNGAVPLVIALEAPNKRAAESIATGKLYESYPEGGDNFFNPKTVEDQTGHPRPAVGQFDEKFAADNVFDGNAWTPKGPEPELPAGPSDLMAQPANVRIAAVVMYGDGEIDDSQLSLVVDLLNDEETPDDTGMRAVIDGLVSVPAVGAMYPASVYKLVSALFQNTTAMPTREATTAFAQAWVDKPDDRENLTQNSTSTSTSTSTDNTGGAADYNTLSMHTALSIMGVNPADAKAADVKNAKEIIANRDNAWRAWDKTLRVIVGILNVETDVRHGIISDGLKNLKLISDDAERLHFVKSRLAGHPACAELANYGKGDEKPVEVANLGGGRFSIEGLIGSGEPQHTDPDTAQPAASNQGEKTEVAQQQVTDAAAAQAKQQLDQMGYGVYANAPAEKSPQLQQAEENADRAEALAQQLKADDFQQRAAQVAQVIAEQPAEAQKNLDIWKRVMRTDPRYTKPIEGAGYVGTSINSEYMFMRATEIFGPIGTGWGFDIVEEKMIAGAPMSEAVFEGGKIIGNRILRDADGSILFEQNHSLLIEFWYVLNGTKGRVTAYGATPYMYKTKRGFMADGEVMKKSLTDAIKKSLSMLGFSADVFLGWHDLPEYREENATEFAIRNASDKAEDVTRLREELDEKLAKVADTITSAVTVNEASKVHASIAREVETHRKAAEAKGDADHAKYLAGRLRRLTALKDERIAALSEEKAP